MWHLAALVFVVAIFAPLLKLLTSLYVLLPLHIGRRPWRLATVFRWTESLRPWAMMEVFLLGIIVAYVKLSDLATIELNVALYAFVALIIVMIAADSALEPHAVWERLGPQARTAALADLSARHARELSRLRPDLSPKYASSAASSSIVRAAAPRCMRASRTASPAPGRC